MVQALDRLDEIAAESFPGYVVRKDLARRFKGRYPVPEYVSEFLLGRYCSSTDEAEIAEGLAIVELQMRDRTVRPGEEELFKSRAREFGNVRLIDLITARLNPQTDSYYATLPCGVPLFRTKLTQIQITADPILWPYRRASAANSQRGRWAAADAGRRESTIAGVLPRGRLEAPAAYGIRPARPVGRQNLMRPRGAAKPHAAHRYS